MPRNHVCVHQILLKMAAKFVHYKWVQSCAPMDISTLTLLWCYPSSIKDDNAESHTVMMILEYLSSDIILRILLHCGRFLMILGEYFFAEGVGMIREEGVGTP